MTIGFRRRRRVAMATALAGLLVAWGAPAPAAQALKIGVVDVQQVGNQSQRGKTIKQKLEQEMALRQKELAAREQEVMKLQAEFEKQAPVLSEQAKREKSEAIQRKARDFRRMAEDANRELEKRLREAEADITREIFGVIQEYGKDQGYTLILDSRTVSYSSSVVDITAEIIKRYDSKQR